MVAVGAALTGGYLTWDGDNAGQDIGLEFYQPFLWRDKGDFLPAVGRLVASGPSGQGLI